ncbi:MAG: glutaredoxin family protein [Chloroflexi bacterium]|nr:MAG: glutaredoxin family protein [Chloroflexota bacterium]
MDDITIYIKPGCPYCAAAKEDFRQRAVAYVEHDVLSDPAALARMLALNGGRRNVPTIVEGGRVTVGFGGY